LRSDHEELLKQVGGRRLSLIIMLEVKRMKSIELNTNMKRV